MPPAVWREVVEEGGTRPGAAEIRQARDSGWISVREPVNTDLVRLLEQDLHAGEAESIVLAIETKPDVILLDEAEARRIAGLYNIPVRNYWPLNAGKERRTCCFTAGGDGPVA